MVGAVAAQFAEHGARILVVRTGDTASYIAGQTLVIDGGLGLGGSS